MKTQVKPKRFLVALSFAGENRARVEAIALSLAVRCGRSRVLYDHFHEAEFARPNLDTYLQDLYHDHSELNVVFLSKDYERKEWCGLEWRAIRDLIKHRNEEIMFLRVDHEEVSGVFSIDGYIDISSRSDHEVAQLIINRLEQQKMGPSTPRDSPRSIIQGTEWRSFIVDGSALTLESGLCGTSDKSTGYTPESFSGRSTVVLGAPDETAMASIPGTTASWSIPVDDRYVAQFSEGFLVIACLRFFGGLHSFFYNTRAAVYLNKTPVDFIDLRIKPQHHGDYFHRIPTPTFPKDAPLSLCQTIYAWTILKDKLVMEPNQLVAIKIDSQVWWDIDYVALVIKDTTSI